MPPTRKVELLETGPGLFLRVSAQKQGFGIGCPPIGHDDPYSVPFRGLWKHLTRVRDDSQESNFFYFYPRTSIAGMVGRWSNQWPEIAAGRYSIVYLWFAEQKYLEGLLAEWIPDDIVMSEARCLQHDRDEEERGI